MKDTSSMLDMSLDDIAAKSRAAAATNRSKGGRMNGDRERIFRPNIKTLRRGAPRHFSGPKLGSDGRWLHDMFNPNDNMDVEVQPTFATHDKAAALGAARLLRDSAKQSSSTHRRGHAGEDRPIARPRRDRDRTFGARTAGTFSYRSRNRGEPHPGNRQLARKGLGSSVKFSNMSYALIEENLKELCEAVGEVEKVWIDYDKFDRSAGTGGCIFSRRRDAEKAMRELDGQKISGQSIRVELIEF